MMKKFSLLFALLSLVFMLTACGGGGGGGAGGTTSGMAGDWVYTYRVAGYSYQLVLDIEGSDDDFSGRFESNVQGISNLLGEFTGSRSGNSVDISFYGSTPYTGRLSGRRLTFDNFVSSPVLDGPITFVKQ